MVLGLNIISFFLPGNKMGFYFFDLYWRRVCFIKIWKTGLNGPLTMDLSAGCPIKEWAQLSLHSILIKLRVIAKNEQSIRRFYGLQSSQRPSNSMWVKSKFYILRPTKLSTAQATLLIFIMLAFALAIVILEKTFRNCNAGRRTEANGYIIYPWPWKFSKR